MTDDATRYGDSTPADPGSEPTAALTEAATAPPPLSPTVPPSLPPPPDATGPAPPRDRWWIHFVWEGALLVLLVLAVGGALLFGRDNSLLRDPALLGDRMFQVAPFLLLATALAVSIRVRAVNLAVGAVAALAAVLYLEWDPHNVATAMLLPAAAAVGAALVLTALVVGVRAPGWAASLAAAMAATLLASTIVDRDSSPIPASWLLFTQGRSPLSDEAPTASIQLSSGAAAAAVLAVILISIVGGAIGMFPGVRRLLGTTREAAAEPHRRGLTATLTTGGGLLLSCLLAAAAGILAVLPSERVGAGFGPRVVPSLLEPIAIAIPLAIVLLGGTSLWGKRDGVFGTFLAALVLFVAFILFDELSWFQAGFWIPLVAIVIGLVVGWLVEVLGRVEPRPEGLAPDGPSWPGAAGVAAAWPGEPGGPGAPLPPAADVAAAPAATLGQPAPAPPPPG